MVFLPLLMIILYLFYWQTVEIFEADKKVSIYSSILRSVEADEKVLQGEIVALTEKSKMLSEILNRSENESKIQSSNITCFKNQEVSVKQYVIQLTSNNYELRTYFSAIECLASLNFLNAFANTKKDNMGNAFYFLGRNNDLLFKNQFESSVVNKNLNVGVVEIISDQKIYIVSFIRHESGVYLIRYIDKNVAYETLIHYKEKILAIALAFVSLFGLLSLWFSIKLTSPIIQLRNKLLDFVDGDMKVMYQVKSKDEIGEIGNVFNQMILKINKLVDELKVYSNQLEAVIKKRTSELRKAIGLQGAMINSLDQGFFMIDNKYRVQDVYSKSMKDILGENFEKESIITQLSSQKYSESTIKTFLENAFKESIPFSSLKALGPKRIETNGKIIDIIIEPIRNRENHITLLLFILSDVTEKLVLERQVEEDKLNGILILNIMSRQQGFMSMIKEISNYFTEISNVVNVTKYELFRFAHTLKGAFLMYDMNSFVKLIHNYEDRIKILDDNENIDIFKNDFCLFVDEYLTDFFKRFPFLIGGQDWKHLAIFRNFEENNLYLFAQELELQKMNDASFLFKNHFIYSSKIEIFSSLLFDIDTVAKKLNKEVLVEVVGGEDRIDPRLIIKHIPYLMHLTRNSIDHGIEDSNVRIESGKQKCGTLTIDTIVTANELLIILSDDGKGINTEELIKKSIEKGINVAKVLNPIELIFEAEVSTKNVVSEFSGRGVGLSAVKDYFEGLGGSIRVSSTLNQGTCFNIRIPV